jgi:hypothetical protein
MPDRSNNWLIKKNTLFFKKHTNIPVCYIEDDVAYIFLDNKIHNKIIKLTKHLMSLNIEFYFTSPLLSSPKMNKSNELIIECYLFAYSDEYFSKGFNDIGFDLIYNMVKYTEKEDCFNSIKDCFKRVEKIINKHYYDYYTRTENYDYSESVRESFIGLYRDILISKIL